MSTGQLIGQKPAPEIAKDLVRKLLIRYAIVWILLALVVVARVIYSAFLVPENLRNILAQNSALGIVAIGVTFVMVAGGFDLSVGSIAAVGAVVYATYSKDGSPFYVAVLPALVAGTAAGSLNGVIITRFRINPLVTTLGTSSAFSGIAYLYTRSAAVVSNSRDFVLLGAGQLAGIPICVITFFVLLIVGGVVLARTVYGRSVYAIGGNNEAARLWGIRVDLVRASTYMVSGMCAALAGILIASRSTVGEPNTGGFPMVVDSIAAVVIGGTSILGGQGVMWGTLVGLLILGTMNNLLQSSAVEPPVQLVAKGVILTAAIGIDLLIRSRRWQQSERVA